jgi:hypothetical protein
MQSKELYLHMLGDTVCCKDRDKNGRGADVKVLLQFRLQVENLELLFQAK